MDALSSRENLWNWELRLASKLISVQCDILEPFITYVVHSIYCRHFFTFFETEPKPWDKLYGNNIRKKIVVGECFKTSNHNRKISKVWAPLRMINTQILLTNSFHPQSNRQVRKTKKMMNWCILSRFIGNNKFVGKPNNKLNKLTISALRCWKIS